MLSRSLPLRLAAVLCVLFLSTLACAMDYNVDCANPTPPPGTYNTINAVIPLLSSGDQVFISGTCSEDVTLYQLNKVNLFGSPSASLVGGLSILHSNTISVFGLNVTSPYGNGIYVGTSSDITLDSCTSNGNSGIGLAAESSPAVYVMNSGSFDNNGSQGISVTGDSTVWLYTLGSTIDISNNVGSGIYASGGSVTSYGNVTITGNKAVPGGLAISGFGIDFRGASKGQFGTVFGTHVISGNDTGGVSLQENSEISFWGGILLGNPDLVTVIQNNGSTGVVVGLGSQATFFEGTRILGHSDAGIDIYGKSQAYFSGDNKIQGNGTGPFPQRSGLRVDGNSEAFIRGGQITQNGGPGILALVNSSIDFAGVSFSQNTGGAILCDSSAYMVSDLNNGQFNAPPGFACRTPHNLGGHRAYRMGPPRPPDWSKQKARHDFYKKLVADHQKRPQ